MPAVEELGRRVTGQSALSCSADHEFLIRLVRRGSSHLSTVIDPTGGVHDGGAARFGTEDGWIEIASTVSGDFDGPLSPG